MDSSISNRKANEVTPKFSQPPKWLRVLIIFVLVLGVCFRFANLDQKLYTTDEVRGLLRISGYTSQEFVNRVYNGNVITVADIQKYQYANSEETLTDAIKAIAGNPEHPPLYYLMARFWTQWFGNPVAARNLTAFISLFIFPSVYWLCLELFELPLVGWIAIALIAVSPFHFLLAQEARQYSLWTVATLLSSAALLQALHLKNNRSLVIYAATVALGIYSHLFFVWVILAQGIYVLLIERLKLSRTLITSGIAALAGILTFVPWVLVVSQNLDKLDKTTRWVSSYQTSLLDRFKYWLPNLSVIFIDFNAEQSLKNPIIYLILVLVAYSLYFLCRQTPRRVWSFILLLIGVIALAQVIPDVIWGGRRSLLPRYLLPSYLGIQLGVAYLLASKISAISVSLWRKRLWQLALVILISVGVLSCASSTQARDWWKGSSTINLQVAPVINQASEPLIISDANHTFILPLSYLLDSRVQLQLFDKTTLNQFKQKLDISQTKLNSVFLYFPSKELLNLVERRYQYKPRVIDQSKWFPKKVLLYEKTN